MRIEQLTESTVLCLHKNLREAISPGNHVPCHVPESCIQRKVKISTHISKRWVWHLLAYIWANIIR